MDPLCSKIDEWKIGEILNYVWLLLILCSNMHTFVTITILLVHWSIEYTVVNGSIFFGVGGYHSCTTNVYKVDAYAVTGLILVCASMRLDALSVRIDGGLWKFPTIDAFKKVKISMNGIDNKPTIKRKLLSRHWAQYLLSLLRQRILFLETLKFPIKPCNFLQANSYKYLLQAYLLSSSESL